MGKVKNIYILLTYSETTNLDFHQIFDQENKFYSFVLFNQKQFVKIKDL